MACFLIWSALLALACFCVDFFWFDFGDLSPITLMAFCELTPLRHVSFPAGKTTLPAEVAGVNSRRAAHQWERRARRLCPHCRFLAIVIAMFPEQAIVPPVC